MRLIKWKDCRQDNSISATGQRTAKHVYSSSDVFEHSDYYVYDASGNLMSVYRKFSDANEQVLSYSLTERPMYGSSRLGVDKTTIEFIGYTPPTNGLTNHVVGLKQYEGSNHLGNILTTFSDKKLPVDANSDGIIDYSTADITSSTDYYPFGVTMNARDFTSNVSRFGFNGNACPPYWRKKDEETETMDFGARLLDGDLGVWLACDPLMAKYNSLSPYCFVGNMVLIAKDVDGRDIVIVDTAEYQAQVTAYLFSLATKSGKGAELVKNAIESGRTLVIVQSEKGVGNGVEKGGGDGFGGPGNYEVLFFNIDEANEPYPDNKGLYKTPETILAHEIDHFMDPMSNAAILFDENGKNTLLNASEVHAVETENIVRSEMSLNARKNYKNVEVYGKGIEKYKNYDNAYILKDKKDYAKPTNKTSANYNFSNVKLNKNEPRGLYKTYLKGNIALEGGGLVKEARQVVTQTRISSNGKK